LIAGNAPIALAALLAIAAIVALLALRSGRRAEELPGSRI